MLLVNMKSTPSTDPVSTSILIRDIFFKEYIKVMHDCDKNNPSVILANFYHKSFTFRKNAAFYGSKDLEGAVRATVFSPEMENNIKHRLLSETFIFIV